MEKSEPIVLPDKPKDTLYEHLVLAAYNCLGFYMEHNVRENVEGTDILEIDGFATNFSPDGTESILVECKSSTHGFADLFKIVGWMTYLNIGQGSLIGPPNSKESKDNLMRARGKDLAVDVIQCEDTETALSEFNAIYGNPSLEIDQNDLNCWRYSYWLQDKILKKLKAKQKGSGNAAKRFKILSEYYEEINNGIFFTRNIIDRVSALYDAYKRCPNLTLKCSAELSGKDFEFELERIDSDYFKRTFINCEFTDLQISSFLEHKARLTIMKNSIEYKILTLNGVDDDRTRQVIDFLGFDFDKYDLLPESLKEGIEVISKERYFHLHPRFWQSFFYLFGGFVLLDRKADEYRLLSSKTGIPAEHIDEAFASYGKIFPNTWFNTNTYSNIYHLKLMPTPLMGIGAYYRARRYTKTTKYGDIGQVNEFAQKHMGDWNDSAYGVLAGK